MHARFLQLRLCMYNRLKYQFLVKLKIKIKKFQHPFLAWYVSESQNICACTDGMFEQETKLQYLQTWRWSVVPNESSRDFGPCDRFMTQLTRRPFHCRFNKVYYYYYRARTFAHAPTECFNKRQNCSTSRRGAGASYQTSHPGISARAIAFGRSWPFAAFCYRPCLPVRHWGRDMSAPKPYVTNPTPTHSSRPPLSLQFNLRFRWLIYSKQRSFSLSYGKHWSRALQSVRTRSAKGNIDTCVNLLSSRISE